MRSLFTILCLVLIEGISYSAEVFVTIHQVDRQTITISESAGGGRGRRGRGRGFGRQPQTKRIVVPSSTKITTASRERRTGDFRVGVELTGGLRNRLFRNLGNGLPARIVTDGRKITQINVMIDSYDINQTTAQQGTGKTIIAVRPKRPPMKR